MIRQFEGCQLTAYADSGGVMTIAYGHTGSDVHPGLVWTQAQAEAALEQDAAKASSAVDRMARNCTQSQFDALTDFVFNLGSQALAGSTLLKLHNAGEYPQAAAQFGLWVHCAGRVLPGLVRRRAAEAHMYLEGVE
jgi:lysozyme